MTAPECCTGDGRPASATEVYARVDLSCGCQDVVYADGTVCYEHNHVECGAVKDTGG